MPPWVLVFVLQQGYAVIFLTRKEALRPFSVAFGQTDILEVVASSLKFGDDGAGDVQVTAPSLSETRGTTRCLLLHGTLRMPLITSSLPQTISIITLLPRR